MNAIIDDGVGGDLDVRPGTHRSQQGLLARGSFVGALPHETGSTGEKIAPV
ncbi:MAG: hypothetical protein IH627_10225 [Rubrivivax sp.]|nr:hypothetical protein [Rubrivivax sp.]